MTDHPRLRSSAPYLRPVPAPDPCPASPLRRALDSDSWVGLHVADLASVVGGIDQLEALDAVPLPLAEPFDWGLVAHEHHARIRELLDLVEARAGLLIDDQHRTIVRRLVARIASRHPDALTRTTPLRTSAALTWLVLAGNDLGAPRRTTGTFVWSLFGVSSCAERGRALLADAGLLLSVGRGEPSLTDPALLHSGTRQRLMWRRDEAVEMVERHEARVEANRVVKVRPDGKVEFRCVGVTPRWAMRLEPDGQRAMVAIALGQNDDDELLAVTVPDARRLMQMLESALDVPFHRPTG